MFRRTVGTKKNKGFLHRMNIKDIMIIYLCDVSGILSKTMLQGLKRA